MSTKSIKLGRRAGTTHSREHILKAAQLLFARQGYDATTVQAIAHRAKVDQSLVIYFFKTKQQLFFSATALTYSPFQEIPRVLSGDRKTVGRRFASYMVAFLESTPEGQTAIALVRSSTSEPAATTVKNAIEEQIISVIAGSVSSDHSRLRASFICSLYMGYVMARYVLKIKPLAETDNQTIVDFLAPVLQHYITGEVA